MYKSIDDKLTELKKLRPLTKDSLKRLSEDFMIKYTYDSNAIEGSTLTHDETYRVIKEGITVSGKPLKHHLDAMGHKDAYYYIEDLVKKKKSLDENVIKKIHYYAYSSGGDERGIYRVIQNYIGYFTPCPPEEVPSRMKDLMYNYNNKYQKLHVIERAATFHLAFETIHPFVDGNGRTGRLLLNFELMKHGLPPINIKHTDKHRYFEAFNHYRENNYTPAKMTELVSEYALSELDRYIEIIKNAEKLSLKGLHDFKTSQSNSNPQGAPLPQSQPKEKPKNKDRLSR